jgi:hypothetical protein
MSDDLRALPARHVTTDGWGLSKALDALDDAEATEVWVAGDAGPTIWWGLTYDRLSGIRARNYPRAVHAEPIIDLAELLGPAYPGTFALGRR